MYICRGRFGEWVTSFLEAERQRMQEEAEKIDIFNKSVTDTLVEQALVQEYVNQVGELLTKIENLGYHITDDTGYILSDIEINFCDKMIEIF